MKRKLEERLARLAFDDLSPSETAELERLAASDTEAARMLNEYRSMRNGLRDLADVPPHQLSNDRLRDAILGQGLRVKPQAADLSWLWMSGTACTAAAILFVFLGRNRPVATEVVFDPNHVGTALARADDGFGHGLANLSKAESNPVRTFPKLVAISRPSRPVIRRARHHRRVLENPESGWYASILSNPPDDASVAQDTPVASASTVAEADSEATAKLQPVDKKPDDGVVVIEPDTDQATGAQKATELGTTKNVEVGG